MFIKWILFIITLIFTVAARAQCDISEKAYSKGLQLYQRKMYLLSLQEFSLAQKYPCNQTQSKAAWGYLLSLTELNEKEEMFHLAINQYPQELGEDYKEKIKIYQSYHFGINDNSPESNRVEKFKAWEQSLPPIKSPAIAATLSAILPGAGQFYDGSWQSGALAFVLNALFLSATLELQNKDLHSTALVSGVVFSITYVGNILNAAESAKIYNQNYYRSEIESEKRRQLPELSL